MPSNPLSNLAGASFALWMILVTRAPPDRQHPFGHGKAEYFSSGFEGILILGAALAIIWAGVERLLAPQPIESPGWDLAWSAAATAINFAVARVLAQAGERFNSIALRADSRHLMTDVWTSFDVIAGVALAIPVAGRWGPWAGVAPASIEFTLAHVAVGPPVLWLASAACGAAWALLGIRTRSLWPGLVCHWLWDVAVMFVAPY